MSIKVMKYEVKKILFILGFSFTCIACATSDDSSIDDYVATREGWLYMKKKYPERVARLQEKYNYDEVFEVFKDKNEQAQ